MARNVRVTTIAENKLTSTPSASVIAKPFTKLAPKEEPNQKRIRLVMRVAMFESRMEGQARFQPRSIAWNSVLPLRNSSFKRSNIRMLASRALPVDRIRPAIPGKVSVTGISLKSANVIAAYIKIAKTAVTPGNL